MNKGKRNSGWVAKLLAVSAVAGLLLWQAPGAIRADESDAIDVAGSTEGTQPRSFKGKAWLDEVGGERVVIAKLEVEGLGEVELQAPAPAEGTLTGVKVSFRAAADGAADALEDLLGEDEDDLRARLRVTPVLGDAEGDAGDGEGMDGEGEDAPEEEQPPRVEILKADGSILDSSQVYLVGEKVELSVRVVMGDGSVLSSGDLLRVRWNVPGSLIKTYQHDVVTEQTIWEGRPDVPEGEDMHVGQVETTVESMKEQDLRKGSVSFYWTSEGQGRDIRVDVSSPSEFRLRGSVTVAVRRSDIPAREIYTAPGMISSNWEVLPNHSQWHFNFQGEDRFILFHREFLRAYNNWRTIFGYLPIESVASTDEPGGGLEKPTYLSQEGGETESPQHDAKKLADFDTMVELGDDLESPWHNRGHGTEGSRVIDGLRPNRDMNSVLNAPKCEVFYIWHTKIDEVGLEWEYLKRAGQLTAQQPEPPVTNASFQFTSSGGLAGFAEVLELDAEGNATVTWGPVSAPSQNTASNTLSADEMANLNQLATAAGFFDLPDSFPPPEGLADGQSFSVTVSDEERGGRTKIVRSSTGADEPVGFRALKDALAAIVSRTKALRPIRPEDVEPVPADVTPPDAGQPIEEPGTPSADPATPPVELPETPAGPPAETPAGPPAEVPGNGNPGQPRGNGNGAGGNSGN